MIIFTAILKKSSLCNEPLNLYDFFPAFYWTLNKNSRNPNISSFNSNVHGSIKWGEKRDFSLEKYSGSTNENKCFLIYFQTRLNFAIFEEKESLPSYPLHGVKSSLEKNKFKTAKVQVLSFKTRPSGLLCDFCSQSYNSLNYRQFFIVIGSLMPSVVTCKLFKNFKLHLHFF